MSRPTCSPHATTWRWPPTTAHPARRAPAAAQRDDEVDLADLAAVAGWADDLRAAVETGELPPISGCRRQRGACRSPEGVRTTPQGLETTFAVNHLAHVVLVDRRLDVLDAGGPRGGHVVGHPPRRRRRPRLRDPGTSARAGPSAWRTRPRWTARARRALRRYATVEALQRPARHGAARRAPGPRPDRLRPRRRARHRPRSGLGHPRGGPPCGRRARQTPWPCSRSRTPRGPPASGSRRSCSASVVSVASTSSRAAVIARRRPRPATPRRPPACWASRARSSPRSCPEPPEREAPTRCRRLEGSVRSEAAGVPAVGSAAPATPECNHLGRPRRRRRSRPRPRPRAHRRLRDAGRVRRLPVPRVP